MLKFNEIQSILIEIKSITSEVGDILSNPNDSHPELIKTLFDNRELLLEKTKGFSLNELPEEYSLEQKEHLSNLLKSLIDEDKSNLELLHKKVEETKESLVNLQTHKSVLIYSKS